MTTDTYVNHDAQNKWSDEADQIEQNALRFDSASYSSSQTDEVVSGQFVEDQSLAESQVADSSTHSSDIATQIYRKLNAANDARNRKDFRKEQLTMGVERELARRQRALTGAYPFNLEQSKLTLRKPASESHNVYKFLLKVSTDASAKDRETFEDHVAKALKAYLGPRSIVRPFGWRSLTEEEARKRIKQQFVELNQDCGEWRWAPDVGFPDDPNSKLIKDLGIDVVAWIPFPDKREGQLFVFTQCATGANWPSKLNDIDWNRIQNWVRPIPCETTSRCIAIPFHIPNSAQWKEITGMAGLILDRVRLTLLLGESQLTV